MGIYDGILLQLASVDMDFVHAGQPGVWNESAWFSSDESTIAHRKLHPVISFAQGYDQKILAILARRWPFCIAPAPRRIGCLGLGTEGRAEHVFLSLHSSRLRAVRDDLKNAGQRTSSNWTKRITHHASGITLSLAGVAVFFLCVDEQADGGHAAFRAFVAGFLAITTLSDF